MRNALHQAAIAQKDIGMVINDFETRTIEFRSQYFFSQRHAYRIGNSLAERPGSGFYARSVAIFWMTRRFGMQLAKILDILNGNIITSEM